MILIDEPFTFGGYNQQAAHMVSDTSLDELHDFARRIGLKREWFQANATRPHYDLIGKRVYGRALERGATRVSSRELLRRAVKE